MTHSNFGPFENISRFPPHGRAVAGYANCLRRAKLSNQPVEALQNSSAEDRFRQF
jgi:hypothetical protein